MKGALPPCLLKLSARLDVELAKIGRIPCARGSGYAISPQIYSKNGSLYRPFFFFAFELILDIIYLIDRQAV